jgi:hypothetical protein
MHHNRHKNILKTMRKLAEIDEEVAHHLTDKIALLTPNAKSIQHFPRTFATSPTDDSEVGEVSPIPRRGRGKQARKIGGPNTSNKKMDIEVFAQQETNFISEAIHLVIHEGKGAWESADDYGLLFRKAEDEEPKQTHPEADVESDSESTTTLCAKPAELNRRQRRLVKKVTTIMKTQQIRKGCRSFSPRKDVNHDPYEGLDPQILSRLGVKVVNPPTNSTTRKELVCKLMAQIKEDLTVQAQEQAEAKMREDGFWRWAGKGAYHSIMGNRESIDWATGMKRSASKESSKDETLSRTLVEAKEAEEDVFDNCTISEDKPFDAPLENDPADKTHDSVAVQEPETKIRDVSIARTEKAAIKRPKPRTNTGGVRPRALILRIMQ